jgi:hypothetical protein
MKTHTKIARHLALIALVFFAVTARLWCAPGTGGRYALVIGNAEYKNIEKLTNTINDAQDIAAALRGLGFEVDLRLNVRVMQFDAAIDSYVAKLAGNSNSEGFFWYAGHGVQIENQNYLLPVDASIESERSLQRSAFSLDKLLADLASARNKVNVVILDACRNNPLPSSSRGAGGTRGLVAIQDVPSDLFVMFSTAPGDVAADGEGKRNSPFAEAFLKHINSTEPLTIMSSHVINETMTLTNGQRPFTRGSIISDPYYSLNPVSPQSPMPERIPPAVSPVNPVPPPTRTLRLALGAGAEGNINTPNGLAGSINVGGDYRILETLGLGARVGAGSDFNGLTSFETVLLARWYFPLLPRFSLFAQAGAGLSVFFQTDTSKMFFLGEGGAGARITLGRFYLEPYMRFGYPFLTGLILQAGFRL